MNKKDELFLEKNGYYWIRIHGNTEAEIAQYVEKNGEKGFQCFGIDWLVKPVYVDRLSEVILRETEQV